MSRAPSQVCVATLGGQPQVITLALDALFARGICISEVIVVHLSTQNPRYQAALACLAREFAGERYAGRPCRYRTLPILLGAEPIVDLASEAATDAALNAFHTLIRQLKQQGLILHLCVSGGRRLLGMLALSAALLYCDQTDRIWHLYSSDAVRQRTAEGAVMHLPASDAVRLVRVPVPPWGHLFPVLRAAPDTTAHTILATQVTAIDAGERARCRQVVERLTPRQREVLQAFAQGMVPQEVAEHLCVSLATVNAHKTPIFSECCIAWDLPDGTRLDYRWLREKFAPYFQA